MMRSKTTERFRKSFSRLPLQIQRQARAAYQRFKDNPQHPSLRFKPVHNTQPIYSVRINLQYRALAVKDDDTLIWFWVGDHGDYDALLKQL
jgi:plasmid maintenance system killer protein